MPAQDRAEDAALLVNKANRIASSATTLDELDQALELYREAERIAPQDWARRALAEANHASALAGRYQHTRLPGDLRTAMVRLERAIPRLHDTRIQQAFTQLLQEYREIESHIPREADVLAALRTEAESLASSATTTPSQLSAFVERVLENRQATHDTETLLTLVRALDGALQRDTEPQSQRIGHYLRGRVKRVLAERRSDRASVEGAIADFSIALDGETDELQRANIEARLADAHSVADDQFARSGSLDEAIRIRQRLLLLQGIDRSSKFGLLHNQANDLFARFRREGRIGDLDASFQSYKSGYEMMPEDAPERIPTAVALATAHLNQYRFHGKEDDFDRAMRLVEAARDLAEGDRENELFVMTSTADTLNQLFYATSDPDYLDPAVDLWRQAIDIEQEEGNKVGFRANLAIALHQRGDKRRDLRDLHEAVDIARDVLARTPEDVIYHLDRKNLLANALAHRYESTHAAQDHDEALALRRELARRSAENPEAASRSARQWLNSSFEARAWLEVVEAFEVAERINRILVQQQGARAFRERQAWLRHAQGTSAMAAYAAAKIGDVNKVRTFLESSALNLIGQSALPPAPPPGDRAAIVHLATTALGTVVLTTTTQGARISFTPLTLAELSKFMFQWDTDGPSGGFAHGQVQSSTWVRTALGAPFHELSARLFESLPNDLIGEGKQELLLIPNGPLSLLPLHAAPTRQRPGVLIDHFTVRYAASAALAARAATHSSHMKKFNKQFVGIANAEPFDLKRRLRGAQAEVERAAARFEEVDTVLLLGPEARKAEMLPHLARTRILHVAVHGKFDSENPLESRIILADEPLQAREVAQGGHGFEGTRLVVLSACQSGVVDQTDLRDECLGFPSLILANGAGGVIAALWSVDDEWTALLFDRFYEEHLQEGHMPAEALRRAQLWLRDAPDQEIDARLDDITRTRGTAATITARPDRSPYYWAAFTYQGV
ncbi:MAG: CHAT domain-containing protein [Candidatus Thermoplasmatota archaeon]